MFATAAGWITSAGGGGGGAATTTIIGNAATGTGLSINATSNTWSGIPIGTAHSDREIWVMATGMHSSGTSPADVTGVTVGGNAMERVCSFVANDSTNNMPIVVFRYKDDGALGTNSNVVVSYNCTMVHAGVLTFTSRGDTLLNAVVGGSDASSVIADVTLPTYNGGWSAMVSAKQNASTGSLTNFTAGPASWDWGTNEWSDVGYATGNTGADITVTEPSGQGTQQLTMLALSARPAGTKIQWTLDPTFLGAGNTITDGVTLTNVSGGANYVHWSWTHQRLTKDITDKVYWEWHQGSDADTTYNGYLLLTPSRTIGVHGDDAGGQGSLNLGAAGRRGNGTIWASTTAASSQVVTGLRSYGNDDVVMMCFQPSTGKWWTGTNGVWDDDPSSTETYTIYTAQVYEWALTAMCRDQGNAHTLVSQESAFTYSVPSGCVALENF